MRKSIVLGVLIILFGCGQDATFKNNQALYDDALSIWKTDPSQSLATLDQLILQAKAVKDHGLAAKSYFLQSFIYRSQDQSEDRFKALTKAQFHVELSEDTQLQGRIYNEICFFYYSGGFWNKAVEFGEKAYNTLEKDPSSNSYRTALFNLGGALSYLGKYEESSRIIMEVPTDNDSQARISQLEWLSLNNYWLGNYSQALAQASECISLQGSDSSAYIINTLGLIKSKQGNSEEAAELFSKSFELDNNYHHAIYNAGVDYEAIGDIDQAIFFYEILRNWDISIESNIAILTNVHIGLLRLQNLYYTLDNNEEAIKVMRESEDLLNKRALTEAAQKELEGIYALDVFKQEALSDLLEEQQKSIAANRQMAILFAGLLSVVLIVFFAWAMFYNRRKATVSSHEIVTDARDVIDFLSVQVAQIELEPKARHHEHLH